MRLFAIGAALLSAAVFAAAAPITGSLWTVPDVIAQNAIPGNVPSTAANVTFQVNSPLQFNHGGTVLQFLTSGGAFNIVGSSADLNRAISNGITSSLIQLTGDVTVTSGQQFTVTHDDGLTLIIGGLSVISVTGPTAPIVTTRTYSGPSGTFPFLLVYGECCGGSAVLQIDLPFQPAAADPVPEPSAAALFATGGALILLGRKAKRH